jgi:hypothetical protein
VQSAAIAHFMMPAAGKMRAKFLWFLNRAAAGVIAATLTGACVGVVLSCYVLATANGSGPGEDLLRGLRYAMSIGVVFGIVLDTAPGVIVMCLSRAKIAPWRSLVFLLPGTTIGIIILTLPWALLPGSNTTSTIMGVMWIGGFAIGGFAAAKFLPNRLAISGSANS